METNTIIIVCVAAMLGLISGLVISKLREKNNASQVTKNAKRDANSIISKARIDAEAIKKDKMTMLNENTIEQSLIDQLVKQGYTYYNGTDISPIFCTHIETTNNS